MLFTLIATAILSAATLAQDKVEYGDIKELAGKTKVFVQSDDLEGRKQIVKELSGKKGLVIVERSEDAEFTLLYKSSESEAGSVVMSPVIKKETKVTGELVAILPGANGARRIVWSVKKSRTSGEFARIPSQASARDFLKAIEKIK